MRTQIALLALVPLAACAANRNTVTTAPIPVRSTSAGMPRPNDRIRVVHPATATTPARVVTGFVQSTAGDTLFVAAGRSLDTAVAYGPYRIQVVTRSRGHAWTGAVIGLLAGAVAGGVIAHNAYRPCTSTEFLGCMFHPSNGVVTGAGVFLGAGVGAGIGAGIGTALRTEEWGTVPLAGSRVSVAVSGIGVRIGF